MSVQICSAKIVNVVPYLKFFFSNPNNINISCPDEITYKTDRASYFRCVLSALSPHQFKKTNSYRDLEVFFKDFSVSPVFNLPYRFFVSGKYEKQKNFMERVTDSRFEDGVFFWLNDISNTKPNKAWFCVKEEGSRYTFYCFSGSEDEEEFKKLYNFYNTETNILEIKVERGNFFDRIVNLAFTFFNNPDAEGADGDINTSKMKELTFFIDNFFFHQNPLLFENVFYGLQYEEFFHRDIKGDGVYDVSKISTTQLEWTDLLDDGDRLGVLYSALEEFSDVETSATMHLQRQKVFDTFFLLVVKCFLEEKRKFFIAVDVFFENFFVEEKMKQYIFNNTFFKLDSTGSKVIADPDLKNVFKIIQQAYFTNKIDDDYYEKVSASSIKQVTKLIFYQSFYENRFILRIFEICALQF